MVFIWNEIYFIFNKKSLNKKFKEKDIKGLSKLDFVYYLTKVMYWIWIGLGFFSVFSNLFIILFIVSFIKFPMYHINKKVYFIYDLIVPFASILTLGLIMISKFIV